MSTNTSGAGRRVIAVITDGMRRDFITPELTPTIAALRQRGTWLAAHRSVFPSVTRVVSSSFATGCYPAKHGLVGNTVCLIEDDRLVLHDVGKPEFIEDKRRLTGAVLNRPTLAERLADLGGAIIFNNVSPGAAYMHDPNGHGHVYHRAGSYGPGRRRLEGNEELLVGQGPEGDTAATLRFADEVVRKRRPAFGLLWLSEPDTTQHYTELGSPLHHEVLAQTDRNVATVIAAVEECRAAGEDILLIVGSDHGHESVIEYVDVGAALVRAGLKESIESDDVVVAANGDAALVYLDPAAEGRRAAIGNFLESQVWAGEVFGEGRLGDAGLPAGGRLAFAVAMACDELPNALGVPGRSYTALPEDGKVKAVGHGMHGGLGRFEQSPYLIIEGGGFATGGEIGDVTSAVDVAPTVLRFFGLAAEGLDGRSLQAK